MISGDQAKLSCSAEGSDVDIQWTVDNTEYESCPQEGSTNICFENRYISDTVTTRSTLIITDSSSLGLGSHTAQCIVQQNLDPEFGAETFHESRTASLHIQGEGAPASLPFMFRSFSPSNFSFHSVMYVFV